ALPGSDGQQLAGALLGRKLLLLVRGRQPGAFGQYPHLEQLDRRFFRKVEFGMRDARASRHPLRLPGANQPGAARAVFVPQRAFQHVGHDLHLAMRMRRESSAARDCVMVEDSQRPESHVIRVVVAVETEQPVRRQPVALQMKSVFGLDDLHISSSDKGRANWQFARVSRKTASKESRQTASLPYPRAALFILSGRRDAT